MKPPRDILKHVDIQTAMAKRKCYRNKKHSVAKGERCLVIKDGAFGSKNYCSECAEFIIKAALKKLNEIASGMA